MDKQTPDLLPFPIVSISASADGIEALRQSEYRFKMAIEAIGGGIYEHPVPLDETLYHSPRWAEILGYRLEELPPFDRFMDWLTQQIHSDDVAVLNAAYQTFIEGKTAHYEVEVRLRHKHGYWIWVRGYSQALARDAKGRVTRVVGLMHDITDHKQTETARHESEERFRVLVEATSQAVWETNAEGVVVTDSPSWRAYTGQTLEEWLGYGGSTRFIRRIARTPKGSGARPWRLGVTSMPSFVCAVPTTAGAGPTFGQPRFATPRVTSSSGSG